MNWVSFISGGMTVIFVYALFTIGQEVEMEVEKLNLERNKRTWL